jgi:hypothetical protein
MGMTGAGKSTMIKYECFVVLLMFMVVVVEIANIDQCFDRMH